MWVGENREGKRGEERFIARGLRVIVQNGHLKLTAYFEYDWLAAETLADCVTLFFEIVYVQPNLVQVLPNGRTQLIEFHVL